MRTLLRRGFARQRRARTGSHWFMAQAMPEVGHIDGNRLHRCRECGCWMPTAGLVCGACRVEAVASRKEVACS